MSEGRARVGKFFSADRLRGAVLLATVLALAPACFAAEKVRVYPFGEDDPGAVVGGVAMVTEDIQEPPELDADGVTPVGDAIGDFVPLQALNMNSAPTYALGRQGMGSLSLDFDGVNDFLESDRFDPRDFNSFAALSQAWVNPDTEGQGTAQSIWSLGTDNGGVGITPQGTWLLRASNGVPDTDSGIDVAFGEWTHLAVFRHGNGSLLYINGELGTSGDAFWFGTGLVTVGAGLDGDSPFDGLIDDFNISGFSDHAFAEEDDIDFFEQVTLTGIPGDVNQDGVADVNDYLIWSENVGFDNGLGGGDPTTLVIGDLDQNGRINYFDFQIIVDAAGNEMNLEAIPEPSAMGLMSLGSMLLLAIGRKKRASTVCG